MLFRKMSKPARVGPVGDMLDMGYNALKQIDEYSGNRSFDPTRLLSEAARYQKRAELKLGSMSPTSPDYDTMRRESGLLKTRIGDYARKLMDMSVSYARKDVEEVGKGVRTELESKDRSFMGIKKKTPHERIPSAASSVKIAADYISRINTVVTRFGFADTAFTDYRDTLVSELETIGNSMKGHVKQHGINYSVKALRNMAASESLVRGQRKPSKPASGYESASALHEQVRGEMLLKKRKK
ncbi:MAG: hypothetical protein HY051_02295 [Candidatus Aenigmarchaeota archaeon]|nr:hypothetical protein [Candidatus Aenigmarchaeota archaeon]